MLLAASLLGLCVAGYFTVLGLRGADRLPRWCRPDEGACRRVLAHPDARLAGVPNALIGVVYYAILALYAAGVLSLVPHAWLTAASWVSVAAGGYLTWSLFVRVRLPCRLCLLSHGLNLVIAVLLTWY